ncbi:MAG: polyprenyl synthetase family protein [Prevotellaceae bacterium]|nr:polyprenyl synthetase family protein [Prevotellaceae bacterium]
MDLLKDIRRPVAGDLERYEALFRHSLEHENDLLGRILAHVAARRGKMMRPLLVLLVSRAFSGAEASEGTLRSAVALELLHTASLIHDDVVDQSALRRGQQSVNSVYGNQLAVLSGDFLLSLALLETARTADLRVVEIIARLGGTLASGEVRQTENVERPETTEADYFAVIRSKTAALFEACARLGALGAGAGAADVERAARLGELVGLCFQIRDDIFDFYADGGQGDADGKLGKPTGADMAEGKLTLPVIHALGAAPSAEMSALAARVKQREATAEEIARLVDFAKQSGGIAYARSVMSRLAAEACALAGKMGASDVAQALTNYVNFVVGRDF